MSIPNLVLATSCNMSVDTQSENDEKNRTKMHLYTKRFVSSLYFRAIYHQPEIHLVKWTDADFAQYKRDRNLDRLRANPFGKNEYESVAKKQKVNENVTAAKKQKVNENESASKKPKVNGNESTAKKQKADENGSAAKKQKADENGSAAKKPKIDENESAAKKQKVDENEKTILKLVLSREGETDTFKSQFKTVNNDMENGSQKNNKNEKKSNKKKNKNNEMNNDENSNKKNNQETESEKKKKSDNDQSKVNLTDHESINSSIEPIEIASEEPLRATESTNSALVGKIQLCDISKLIKDSKLEEYYQCFELLNKISKTSKKHQKKQPATTSTNSTVQTSVQAKNVSLTEIECLYKKYFTKSVQDNIVIIANILNIISLSNKHHKARMDESFKKKSEAEKLKERCDANRMHLRHKKVLEIKLKKYFMEVITEFVYSEFEPAFQMFFLSILTVLRVLDQPKFKKGSIFKNLVLLLWNSLKNSDLENDKVFAMFKSKSFRPDCIDLISLIEDSRDNDPGITDRMSLFFVSSVNSPEYFQVVIDAVTSDSNEDLGLLIDNAAFQCCINSKFKGSTELPSSSTTVNKNVHVQIPLSSIQSTSKNEDVYQRWVLAKTPNGTYQPISMTGPKPKKKTPIIIDPSKASQPINSFYEDFSNSLTRGSNTSVIPGIVVPKGSTITSLPSVSNGSLHSGPTFVTFRPPAQGVRSFSSAGFTRPEGTSTIYVGNKQYHVIRSPGNQLRAVAAQKSIVMTQVKRPEVPVRCFAKNCQLPATIMCSTCRSVKYCSHNCQRIDWYETHINHCERLDAIRQTMIKKNT